MNMHSERDKTIRALEWYAAMGVDDIVSTATSIPLAPKLVPPQLVSNSENKPLSTLEELKSAVMCFEGCALKQTAISTVFADGLPSAKIMLIGEAPGASEDQQGIPFCGESGKLLDEMIASIGLSRKKNVYITNTIFWRPPGNRQPTTQEIEACRPFVEQHIALIRPKLLILVGGTAVTSLLGPSYQISKIRQEYYFYTNKYLNYNITTTAIFHPAYLLRQPMQKRSAWYDLLKIKEFITKNVKDVVF